MLKCWGGRGGDSGCERANATFVTEPGWLYYMCFSNNNKNLIQDGCMSLFYYNNYCRRSSCCYANVYVYISCLDLTWHVHDMSSTCAKMSLSHADEQRMFQTLKATHHFTWQSSMTILSALNYYLFMELTCT